MNSISDQQHWGPKVGPNVVLTDCEFVGGLDWNVENHGVMIFIALQPAVSDGVHDYAFAYVCREFLY